MQNSGPGKESPPAAAQGTVMAGLPKLFAPAKIDQVALVVNDLDEAVRRYWERAGIGPWRIYTYERPLVKEMTYRGRPIDFRMRLALAQAGDIVLELIQPLSQDNIYVEHLARKGPGLNHLGIFVPSVADAVSEAAKSRVGVLQSGRGYGKHGDGAYAYLDTEDLLGVIFEVIEVPKERVPPEAVFPPRD
jgi:glyoxalase/bleomycin resistance protein/dioxygenase superfamily protein